MIIGFSGLKRSGKDTSADYFVGKYSFQKLTFAGPLKEICGILFNFDNEQLYGDKKEVIDTRWGVSPRTVLQFVGTDLFRDQMSKMMPDIKDEFWVKSLEFKCKDLLKKNINIVISDVRFQNEVDMIHKYGGIVIKLERPLFGSYDLHPSEINMNFIKNYDAYIANDGTIDDLHIKIDDVFKKYK